MLRYNRIQSNPTSFVTRLILVACGLSVPGGGTVRADGPGRVPRARGVSQWTRGACAPALAPHVPAHATCVLRTITDLGMLYHHHFNRHTSFVGHRPPPSVATANGSVLTDCLMPDLPCRLCPHVVAVVQLERFSDLWGYLYKTKRDTGVYAVRAVRSSLPGSVCSSYVTVLVNQSSITPKEDPTSLKKARLRSEQWEGPDTGPSVCQGRGNRSNEISCTEGEGGVLSKKKARPYLKS